MEEIQYYALYLKEDNSSETPIMLKKDNASILMCWQGQEEARDFLSKNNLNQFSVRVITSIQIDNLANAFYKSGLKFSVTLNKANE